MKINLLSNIRGDVYGGLTAAVAALPLALAFGVASGIGPIAGLYGAIALGFFAAVFGGTRSQVSGPTGPMTIVMAAVVVQYADNIAAAFAIVIMAGLMQIMFGLIKVGRYISYTPHAVVSGFMSGIGVIIILIQTLPFFGLPTASGGPVGVISQWGSIPSLMNVDAVVVAVITLLVSIFWPSKLSNILPSPLAALLAGTLVAMLFFTAAPVIGNVPTGFPQIAIPDISPSLLPSLLAPALVLALLGSIDSLLTSLVADSITRTRPHSDRELIGQGIGNIAAGLIGGLPGAGATMRTVINVRAGGKTQLSGALHALILLGLVLGLGPLAEQIPHAALAGILMKVGWDIIDWKYLKRIKRAPRDQVVVMAITLAMTVFIDLITAVAVGLILASFVTASHTEKFEMEGVDALALDPEEGELTPEEQKYLEGIFPKVGIITMRGRFSYASARQLTHTIGMGVSGNVAMIFDFTHTAWLDTSAAMAIEDLLSDAVAQTQYVYVSGLSGQALETLEALHSLKAVRPEHIFKSREEAIARVAEKLKSG
ncbi:MAG: SulP family inorganic anion transporter [Rhizobiaceae bacterium]|nr:SulP family inorganic anion transporter [Rhizobiaceae bacterium]